MVFVRRTAPTTVAGCNILFRALNTGKRGNSSCHGQALSLRNKCTRNYKTWISTTQSSLLNDVGEKSNTSMNLQQNKLNETFFSTTTSKKQGGDDGGDNNYIQRIGTDDPRMSKIVIHNNQTLYISGQTDTTSGDDIKSQARGVLNKIDNLLQQGGTTKAHLLSAMIWLRDIERDFKDMNEVWNDWIDPNHKPVRATVQSSMAREAILVEIQIVAAMPQQSN